MRRNNRREQPEQPGGKGFRELLDLPQSALSGRMQIEISGNNEAIVDGCTGVLEYDENTIRLAGKTMSVRFTGRNLQIKVLTHDSAILEGFILNVEFLV